MWIEASGGVHTENRNEILCVLYELEFDDVWL